MMVISDIKNFIGVYKRYIYINLFFAVLAYGYFITHWAISIDSEIATFSHLGWSAQGRFITAIITLLNNYQILPFWNDIISVIFIFISAIVWMTSLARIKYNAQGLLLFSLSYTISPIYAFYLRFTTYNIAVGVGFLCISLSIYYLVLFFEDSRFKKNLFALNCLFLILAIAIYQIFAIYYITACLIVILYKIFNNNCTIVSPIKMVAVSIQSLIISLVLYKFSLFIIYQFAVRSNYIDGIIQWGSTPSIDVIHMLQNYFVNILFNYRFNFFLPLTLIITIPTIVIGFFCKKIKLFTVILFITLIISVFIIPVAFGNTMPFRTLQSGALMLAGAWLLVYSQNEGNIWVKRLLFITAIVCTIFNAQYINRLFYSDNMRLIYDTNFANRIYTKVIDTVGDSIETKPLVIVGEHSNTEESFLVKSDYDTLGASFFQWDNGNYWRIHNFMYYIGDEFIQASKSQYQKAVDLSSTMPNYPAKDSIIETKDMIILKLSPPITPPADIRPININLNKYKELKSSLAHFNLDNINLRGNNININGWVYIKNANAFRSNIFLVFSHNNSVYTFATAQYMRKDVAGIWQRDGINIQYSGFNLDLTKNTLPNGLYNIGLIIINNNQSYVRVNTIAKLDLR